MPGIDPAKLDAGAPATESPTGLTVGLGPQQRLQLAMRQAREGAPSSGLSRPGDRYSYLGSGVPNPNGVGLHAFEPNNTIFDAYASAYNDQQVAKAKAAAEAEAATAIPGAPAGSANTPLITGTGAVRSLVEAALTAASRRVPYVWGGTNLGSGVDCSGLIYAAARSAGINMPRYRAVDYGHMGQAVTLQDARPGDIAYYDEAGDTDHVGIYIGNGQVIQAPQSGDVVRVTNIGRVTSIRRIFDDQQFGTVAAGPSGGTLTSYAGSYWNPAGTFAAQSYTKAQGSTITRAPINRDTTGFSPY